MEVIGIIFEGILEIMRIPFTIFGFTLSLWNVFVFALVVGVVAWAVWTVILDE